MTNETDDDDIPVVLMFLNALGREFVHKTLENAQISDAFLENNNKRAKKLMGLSKAELLCLDRSRLMDYLRHFNAMMHQALSAWSEKKHFMTAAHEKILYISEAVHVELTNKRAVENPQKWLTKRINLQ